jgi:hypothetical protein
MATRLDALTVRESDGKSYWTRIGVAFPNRDGAGYRVLLDAVPASTDGQYIIHLREPRDDGGQKPAPRQPRRDDLDDDVAF